MYFALLILFFISPSLWAAEPNCGALIAPRGIFNILNTTEDLSCDPELNKPLIVNEAGPARMRRAYKVTRTKEDEYLVEINPRFIYHSTSKSESDHQQLNLNFKKFVSECLQKVEPYFLGPKGEKLKLRLSNENNTPEYVVKIQEPDYRSGYRNYAEKIDCPTVIHETFHNFGLIDEYEESETKVSIDKQTGKRVYSTEVGYPPNCRSLGPEDSLLNNQEKALGSVLGFSTRTQTECLCKENEDDKCKDTIEKAFEKNEFPKKCPSHFNSNTYSEDSSILKDLPKNPYGQSSPISEYDKESSLEALYLLTDQSTWKYGTKAAYKKSLLRPAHFNVITQPNCMKKNRTYYECTKNGSQPKFFGCYKVPRACSSKDADWLK